MGGRVEPHELGDLKASALRELAEETGIAADEIEAFTHRRTLIENWGSPEAAAALLYFSGRLREPRVPDSPDGTLRWLHPDEFGSVDVIESTRLVLPSVVEDDRRDPDGREAPRMGVARWGSAGLENLAWV